MYQKSSQHKLTKKAEKICDEPFNDNDGFSISRGKKTFLYEITINFTHQGGNLLNNENKGEHFVIAIAKCEILCGMRRDRIEEFPAP